MREKLIQNLIIGAGPAGLAVAGRMKKLAIPFTILEKENSVGHTWKNHYDRLHLHTVKQLSHLPHLPFSDDTPLYVPRAKVAEYLETYSATFDIKPIFNQEISSIKKQGNNWLINTKNEESYLSTNVIVATGVNRIPNQPTWNGQDTFAGTIIHSRKYKNVTPFLNQKVLIVGIGNTGAELALDLSEHDIETYVSVRGPVNFIPRDVNGRPVQLTAKMLAKFPFGIGDWLGTQIRKRIIGDLTQYGIQHETMHPVEQLRETGKTPVVDIGTVEQIKKGKIKILPAIDHFYKTGVVFQNGEQHDFDSVILATGYRAKVEDFIENGVALLDQHGCPKTSIATNEFTGLYFVGFDNYKVGGILGTIFTDSETVVNDLKKKHP